MYFNGEGAHITITTTFYPALVPWGTDFSGMAHGGNLAVQNLIDLERLNQKSDNRRTLQNRFLLESLERACIRAKDVAILIIDPQRSFTDGGWMQSIGYGEEIDVAPIRSAFENCAQFLNQYYGRLKIMFT